MGDFEDGWNARIAGGDASEEVKRRSKNEMGADSPRKICPHAMIDFFRRKLRSPPVFLIPSSNKPSLLSKCGLA
jgi:hypothetical protein